LDDIFREKFDLHSKILVPMFQYHIKHIDYLASTIVLMGLWLRLLRNEDLKRDATPLQSTSSTLETVEMT
jgi:hypothetical protein